MKPILHRNFAAFEWDDQKQVHGVVEKPEAVPAAAPPLSASLHQIRLLPRAHTAVHINAICTIFIFNMCHKTQNNFIIVSAEK